MNTHAVRILIAAAVIVAAGGVIGILMPHSLTNGGHYTGERISVKNFYGNSVLDPKLDCTRVFEVVREVPKTDEMVRNTIEALIEGPTFAEEQKGYFSSLNPNIRINKLSISDGVADITLSNVLASGVEGSCRVAAIRAEITETLLQFSAIKSVSITIEDKKDIE